MAASKQPDYSLEERRHLRALGLAVSTLREERTPYSRFKFSHMIDGVHRNTLGNLENGLSAPGFVTLVRIANGLGVSMSELIQKYEENLESEPSRG